MYYDLLYTVQFIAIPIRYGSMLFGRCFVVLEMTLFFSGRISNAFRLGALNPQQQQQYDNTRMQCCNIIILSIFVNAQAVYNDDHDYNINNTSLHTPYSYTATKPASRYRGYLYEPTIIIIRVFCIKALDSYRMLYEYNNVCTLPQLSPEAPL